MHLRVSEMSVTVYTSEDYKNERVEEGSEFADEEVDAEPGTIGGTVDPMAAQIMETHSDEVMDEADEFSGQVTNAMVDSTRDAAPAQMLEGGEEDSEEDNGLKLPEHKTVDHLLSDFVIDLLEQLEIPEQHIEQLKAEMIHVSTLKQPEELMVHLSSVAA